MFVFFYTGVPFNFNLQEIKPITHSSFVSNCHVIDSPEGLIIVKKHPCDGRSDIQKVFSAASQYLDLTLILVLTP